MGKAHVEGMKKQKQKGRIKLGNIRCEYIDIKQY